MYWAIGCVIVIAFLFLVEIVFREIMKSRSFGAKSIDTTATEGTIEVFTDEDGFRYLKKRKSDGTYADEFKILSSTDFHLRDEMSEYTLGVLGRFLDKEKPDLVILVGDNVVGRSDTVIHEKVKAFFEERGQYWAFVLGNHDGEQYANVYPNEDSRKWAFESLSGAPHCLSVSEDAGYGYGNCVIGLKNSKDELTQAIFLLDSGQGMTEENCREEGFPYRKGCAFLRTSQIEWYQKRVAELTAKNAGKTPKSLMYFHIPLKEFDIAYHAIGKDKRVRRIYGDAWEKIDCSCYSTGMFDAVKRLGSTQAVVCGHDHINGFCLDYDGVKLLYSLGLQWDGSYNRRKQNRPLALWYRLDKKACFYIEGVTDTMIRADGTAEFMPKYAQFENVLGDCKKEMEIFSYGVKGTEPR